MKLSRNDDCSDSEPEEAELVDVIVDAAVDVGGPEDDVGGPEDKVPKKIVSQLLDLDQVDLENEEIWRIVVPIHVRGHSLMTSRGRQTFWFLFQGRKYL